MSKRKIIQEVDLVFLFELFSMTKHKWYIFSEYHNWSEFNQSNCTIHGRKLARFSHAVIDVENIRKSFWWFLESIQTLLKMTFLQCKDSYTSPDFCTPGVGRYASVWFQMKNWYISSQMKTWWCFIQCFIRYQDSSTWSKWSSYFLLAFDGINN